MSKPVDHEYTRDKPPKTRDRHNCCVPQCTEVKTESNHLYTVPEDESRRKIWKTAIKTGKELTRTMQVCSKHFRPEDYFPSSGTSLKPKLKRTAVPSLHLPIRSHDKFEPSPVKRRKEARSIRAAKRSIWSNISLNNGADGSANTTEEGRETSG